MLFLSETGTIIMVGPSMFDAEQQEKADLPCHHLWMCRMRKSNSSCRLSCSRWRGL